LIVVSNNQGATRPHQVATVDRQMLSFTPTYTYRSLLKGKDEYKAEGSFSARRWAHMYIFFGGE
jgi:hypothetical protein